MALISHIDSSNSPATPLYSLSPPLHLPLLRRQRPRFGRIEARVCWTEGPSAEGERGEGANGWCGHYGSGKARVVEAAPEVALEALNGRAARIREMIRQKRSQREIIREIWNVEGGRRYVTAAQELSEILARRA